jgi:hypothetical protein
MACWKHTQAAFTSPLWCTSHQWCAHGCLLHFTEQTLIGTGVTPCTWGPWTTAQCGHCTATAHVLGMTWRASQSPCLRWQLVRREIIY